MTAKYFGRDVAVKEIPTTDDYELKHFIVRLYIYMNSMKTCCCQQKNYTLLDGSQNYGKDEPP